VSRRDSYARYPRPILWLVPGGTLPCSAGIEIAPFYLSKLPVTNEQFEAFDPAFARSPLGHADRGTAVGMSLLEAEEYCLWYAEIARKPMRLPTEHEWEYACRAGSTARCFWGDDQDEAERYAWDLDNSDARVPPPEGKRANGFGLYGMLGGVWEWTSTRASDDGRVLRGGSFRTPRAELSCALRREAPPTWRADDVGFRLAKSFR
jgi:formylglycine-generating enzyme required for sulfatase activity